MEQERNHNEEESVTVRKRPAAKTLVMRSKLAERSDQQNDGAAASVPAASVPPPAAAAAGKDKGLVSGISDGYTATEDDSWAVIDVDGGKKNATATVSIANGTTANVTMADSAPSPAPAASAVAAHPPSANSVMYAGSSNSRGLPTGGNNCGIREQRNNLQPSSATAAAAAADYASSSDSEIEIVKVIPAVQSAPPLPATVTTTTTTTAKSKPHEAAAAASAPATTTAPSTPRRRVKKEIERFSPGIPTPQQKKRRGSHQSPGDAKKTKVASPPSKRKKASLSEADKEILSMNLETQAYKDQRIVVGSTVFAAWLPPAGGDEEYFWGDVTSKTRDVEGVWKYNIQFHDDDKRDGITSNDMHRMDECFKLMQCGLKGYKMPLKKHCIKFYQQEPLTMKELRENSCGICTQCRQKSSCGKCRICRHNNVVGGCRGCCFQKMCCNIITPRKAQPLEGLLPSTWRFYFDEIDANPEREGLVLLKTEEAARVRPNKDGVEKSFMSFEDAAVEDPNAFMGFEASFFYDAVGISPASDRKRASTVSAGADRNCATRPRPRKTIPARKQSAPVVHHQGQQMDLNNDLRAQANIGSSQPGSAPSHPNPVTRGGNDELDSETVVPRELRLAGQQPIASLESGSYTETNNVPVSLADLRRQKCGRCSACLAGDCGKCSVCVANATMTKRQKDACLQRICLQIPEVQRRQDADSFPPGWQFSIGRPDQDIPVDLVLERLQLISPSGVTYKSVESACNHYNKQLQDLKLDVFCKQIGVEILEDVVDDRLLGKGFMNEWRNVNGERKCIFGKVVRVYHNIADENEEKYKVKYGDLRKDMVDTTGTSLGIPETDAFDKERAWAGCLAYEAMVFPQQRTLATNPPFCTSWVVPNTTNRFMYNYRPTPGVAWVRLPQLRVNYNEFQLTFKVQPSSIPNAGYGVFLSVEAWDLPDGKPPHFRLPAGDLLDFGIYAPFRPEDRKSDHLFLMKAFVHNFICSEYSFDTSTEGHDDIFDITNDSTGLLHAEARRHVTPYVNEIVNEQQEKATVHAKYDCEGALHYLLGHLKEEDGDFVLEFGEENKVELFVDYGAKYETVRLRHGYPREHVDEATRLELMKKDEIEYLQEVDSFNANELKNVVDLFASMLEEREQLKSDVIVRIILLLLLLKKRAQNIFLEFDGVEDDESVCDNGGRNTEAVLDSSRRCTFLIKRFVEVWGNSEDLLPTLRQKEAFVEGLGMVFDANAVASFTPVEFVNSIRRDYI